MIWTLTPENTQNNKIGLNFYVVVLMVSLEHSVRIPDCAALRDSSRRENRESHPQATLHIAIYNLTVTGDSNRYPNIPISKHLPSVCLLTSGI